MVQLSHPYMNTGKIIALTMWTFVGKVISLLLHTLSRFVIAFLPRRKHLWISWLQSPSAMILETKKIKFCHYFHFFPIYLPWSDGTVCHDLSFMSAEFQASLFSPLSLSSRGSIVPFHLLPLEWYHLHVSGCWYFSCQSWFQLVILITWHFTWYTLHR